MRRQWGDDELAEHWTLTPAELGLLANKAGATRLGFAVLLKAFTYEGRFPRSRQEIPGAVVVHVADQVGVPAELHLSYAWSGRAIKYHRAQIRAFLGVREATVQDGHELVRWLLEHLVPHDHRLEHLREAAYRWCRSSRLEPPTPDRLERLIRSALRTFEERLCRTVLERLSPETIARLDGLVAIVDAEEDAPEATGDGRSLLSTLKADPGRVGLESVLGEIEKLGHLRVLGLPSDLFAGVSPGVVQLFRQRAAVEPPSELRGHPAPIRALLLAALCALRAREITDRLVDLLIQVIHKIGVRAERKVEKELLEDLRRVTGKTGLLFRIAEAAVEHPDGRVRDVVFPAAGGEQTLRDLVREFQSSGPAYRFQVHTHLRASYAAHYRRMVPPLLEALEFRSNNAVHRPLIRALELLKRYAGGSQRLYPVAEDVPLEGVVRPSLRELVVHADARGRERVDRINYEIRVLQALREHLRCKEIWVVGADRYRNPDEDLPSDFADRRAAYYAALNQPLDADAFVETLRRGMDEALRALNDGLPRNSSVTILRSGKIVVSPLAAQPEPAQLGRLKLELVERWPMTSLLDVLKETDLRVGFTEQFASASSREQLDRATLQKRLLLCLYGLGTNTGLKRVASGDHGETVGDLRYVRRRYLRTEALRAAIAEVADGIFRARRPEIWGEGTTACASDAKKFGAWDQNLLTEWHVRYRGPGVMIYWHVDKKACCIYSQLKSCSSSEVAAMIEGVLRHCTEMTVERQYVDSHGQSEVAFGLTYLLGFQLLPRLKAIGAQKLYRPAAGQPDAYPRLEPVRTRPIHWQLIREQYDELVKYATALRLGTADAEAILRRFTRSAPQHPTYQALAELGKAVKTIFLCRYLSAEALRREIHEGLNVIENWNGANAFIFYGKGGEIASNRLDEQELAVLSLHLLQISLVYINTLMLQRVLGEPDWRGSLGPEDLRALTPLVYAHINPYGTFRLDMAHRLTIESEAAA
jgi:TnpA family transposase